MKRLIALAAVIAAVVSLGPARADGPAALLPCDGTTFVPCANPAAPRPRYGAAALERERFVDRDNLAMLWSTRFSMPDGTPALAHVAVPSGPAPAGGWKLLVVNHGMTGFAPHCGSISRIPSNSTAAEYAQLTRAIVLTPDPVGIGDEVIAASGEEFEYGVAANGEVILDAIAWTLDLAERYHWGPIQTDDVAMAGNCVGVVNMLWALQRYGDGYGGHAQRYDIARVALGSTWSAISFLAERFPEGWNLPISDPVTGALSQNMVAFIQSMDQTRPDWTAGTTWMRDLATFEFVNDLNKRECSESAPFKTALRQYGNDRGWWPANRVPTLRDLAAGFFSPALFAEMEAALAGSTKPTPALDEMKHHDGWTLDLPSSHAMGYQLVNGGKDVFVRPSMVDLTQTLLEANVGPVHRRQFADADHLLVWGPWNTMAGTGACVESPTSNECNMDAARAVARYLMTGSPIA